jgi:hypothetical protein
MQHNLWLTSANTTIREGGDWSKVALLWFWWRLQKVGCKPLDEAPKRPHNSASLLLQTKRFANKETGESQRISVL